MKFGPGVKSGAVGTQALRHPGEVFDGDAGSREGDTVLDPFGGSGTTGLAASELGRKAILIELNPAYARMGAERTAALQPQLRMSGAPDSACAAAKVQFGIKEEEIRAALRN